MAAPVLALVLAGCGADGDGRGAATSMPTTTAETTDPCGRHGDLMTYCGTAAASVTVGGRGFGYRGGECRAGPGHLIVAIGTFPDQGGNTPERFALGVGNYEQDPLFGTITAPAATGPGAPGDGTYRQSTLRVYGQGRRYSVSNFSVTLEGGRTKGTFFATADDGTPVTGSFTC